VKIGNVFPQMFVSNQTELKISLIEKRTLGAWWIFLKPWMRMTCGSRREKN